MNRAYKLLSIFLCSFLLFSCAEENQTDIDQLLNGTKAFSQMVVFSEFTEPVGAEPVAAMSGSLSLGNDVVSGGFELLRDDYANVVEEKLWQRLPSFNFNFVISNGDLLPVNRGIINGDNSQTDIILSVGRAWHHTSNPEEFYISLPFALIEKYENCTFNGVVLAHVKAGGITSAIYQIASETCMYIKFNAWAHVMGKWQAENIAYSPEIISNYKDEVSKRMPVEPIEVITSLASDLNIDQFKEPTQIKPENLTLYGVIYNGVHYVSGCETRMGQYPYCNVLALPSYSLAKSVMASFGLMRLERLFPDASKALISDYVPECSQLSQWQGVTFENALDMATGNYADPDPIADEASDEFQAFFTQYNHTDKVKLSCELFERKSTPGTHFSYHTSDTYILGSAMQAFWKLKYGSDADFFEDLIVTQIFKPLGLSQTVAKSLRSDGQGAPAYTGYGLFFERGDVALLANYLSAGDSLGLFDEKMFQASQQHDRANRGLLALDDHSRYENGFWASNMSQTIGCDQDKWLPIMSGYGGISVVMAGSGTAYYNFSDGGKYVYADGVRELNKLEPLCLQ